MCIRDRLAGGDRLFVGVGNAVDGEGAHAADSFSAVVVEVNGVTAIVDDAFIDDVEHLKEGGRGRNVVGWIGFDMTLNIRTCLAPNFKSEIHANKGMELRRLRGRLNVATNAGFDVLEDEFFFV